MSISRLVTGWILLMAGIFFSVLSIFTALWFLFYGIPLLIIGILILLNKNEDKIEKRKDLKEREYRS
jgi:membrane-bound ClpP family serine protease